MTPSWDDYFLALVDVVATRSKDPSTKVGCVLVGAGSEILSTGYNSFPRGIQDDVPERLERPEKYQWIEHAERNAIYNAARSGVSLFGCTVYVPWFPCMDCARAIVQVGALTVVYLDEPDEERDARWAESHARARTLFDEAYVHVRAVTR